MFSKATVLSAAAPTDSQSAPDLFDSPEAVEPPHDPETLGRLFEHSNSLRQAVDAYATNIDGFGHRLECTINLAAENTDVEIAKSIRLEALASGQPLTTKPTRRMVAERRKEIEAVAEAEHAYLTAFFDTCCFEHSFVELRRLATRYLDAETKNIWAALATGTHHRQ